MIERVELDQVYPDEDNPREADDVRLHLLRLSLQKLGFVHPIYCGTGGMILSGHQRHRVATDLGFKELPVEFVDLKPNQLKGINVLFNRATNDMTAFDTGSNSIERIEIADLMAQAEEMPDYPDEDFLAYYAIETDIRGMGAAVSDEYNRKAMLITATLRRYGIRIPLVVTESGEIVNGVHRLFEARHESIETWPVITVPDAHGALAKNFLNYLSMDYAVDGQFATMLRYSSYRRPQNARGLLPKGMRFWASGERTISDSEAYSQEFWENFRSVHGRSILDFGSGLSKVAPHLNSKGFQCLDFEPYRLGMERDTSRLREGSDRRAGTVDSGTVRSDERSVEPRTGTPGILPEGESDGDIGRGAVDGLDGNGAGGGTRRTRRSRSAGGDNNIGRGPDSSGRVESPARRRRLPRAGTTEPDAEPSDRGVGEFAPGRVADRGAARNSSGTGQPGGSGLRRRRRVAGHGHDEPRTADDSCDTPDGGGGRDNGDGPSDARGRPDPVYSREKARGFLRNIASGTKFDSIFLASVLNSIPFPRDRQCVLALVHSICSFETIVYGTCRDISDFGYEYSGVRNATYFVFDSEPGVRLGDTLSNPKIQKFHSEREFKEIAGHFWKKVETWRGGNIFYWRASAPRRHNGTVVKQAIEFEFDLPYSDGSTMGLVPDAIKAWEKRLGVKL